MGKPRAQVPGSEVSVRVACLGETMLMLAPPRYALIEESDLFRAYIGGSEANVAIGLERLGIHASWIGKLPDNALGRKISNGIQHYGVDTSACIWVPGARLGIFFVEWGAQPRPLRTIYDRANSAMASLLADDLDWTYLARCEWLHLSGITPALSDACRRSVPKIVRRAREQGLKVSFDLNYRSLLWSADDARAAYEEILPYVNLVVGTEEDAALVLGQDAPRETLATRLFERYHPDVVVLTCGGDGSIACNGEGLLHAGGFSRIQIVNRLGAGDAFDAGLLYGYLTSGLEMGLRIGNAMAALKMTLEQNMPLVEPDDVARLLEGQNLDLVR